MTSSSSIRRLTTLSAHLKPPGNVHFPVSKLFSCSTEASFFLFFFDTLILSIKSPNTIISFFYIQVGVAMTTT